MNSRRKLAIDHYVGGPLAWLLNFGARMIARVWRRDHSLRTPPRTILFLKFMGLGSIARAAFLVDDARRKYPGARIAFATFSPCAPLVGMLAAVDEVRRVRDGGLFALAWDTLALVVWSWRHRVDLVIDLEVHSKYSAVVSTLTLARDRAGFSGPSSRFRRGLYTHLLFWNAIRRVDLAYRQLGRAIGLDAVPRWVAPEISAQARAEAGDLLARLGVPPTGRVLGVNPNASELREERRWPAENFARVVEALPPEEGIHVLLLGSPAERGYVERLAAGIRGARVPVHNVAGLTSFAAFVALLGRLTVLLTNDSGPLHIAAGLGTPTVSLWGPGHPAHYAPQGLKHTVFYRPTYCSPCIYTTDVSPCGGDNRCMQQIRWDVVAAATCQALGVSAPGAPRVVRAASAALEPWAVAGQWRREAPVRPLRVVEPGIP